jgi:[ribosomal protein S18]-alanine N-acetyltransferase
MSAGGDVRVRPMGSGDLPQVMEIAQSLKDTPHWTRAIWEAVVDRESAVRRIAVVAEEPEGGALQGFAVAGVAGPEAELESIGVVGVGQRRGVGRRMCRAIAEELQRAGVTEVYLEVRASNRAARAFYAALGFAESGRRTRYYADPEEDAVLMRLRMG